MTVNSLYAFPGQFLYFCAKYSFLVMKSIHKFCGTQSVEMLITCEPRREKTGLRGFRPGPTQTGLYKLRKELEA